MAYSDISKKQIQMLRQTFATLTPDGWVVPEWVDSLEAKCAEPLDIIETEWGDPVLCN